MGLNMEDMLLNQAMAGIMLEGESCQLNHHDKRGRTAVDFLCHQMGILLPDGDGIADSELRIPIWEECVVGLYAGQESLFYCVGCGASQWLLKSEAKNGYPDDTNIIAMKKCPKCYNELLD